AAHAAALANVLSSESNLKDRVVRAEQAGIVERVLVSEGDLMSPSQPVIRMDDPADIWMRVYVPERLLALVLVGDSADLTVDGITGPVSARVESIATRGEYTPANLQTPDERGK